MNITLTHRATDVDAFDRRAVVLFAGFGMDASVGERISVPGYDVLVVYDYTSTDFDISLLQTYREIVLVAWSMGVVYADALMKAYKLLPVTKAIAVNGTLTPIHDDLGIPTRLYDATLAGMTDERAVNKFYRRVCGGVSGMASLMPSIPNRSSASLVGELESIRSYVLKPHDTSPKLWDEIIISSADLIFPPLNMQHAWSGVEHCVSVLDGAAHMIDFADLIDRSVVDKRRVGSKFTLAGATYRDNADVQRRVAQRLASMVADSIVASPLVEGDIIEVGSGEGVFTRMVLPLLGGRSLTTCDLSTTPPLTPDHTVTHIACDAETCIHTLPDASVAMLVSASTIQWMNSPMKFLRQVSRVLCPGGRAFIGYYTVGTLAELVSAATLRYADIRPADITVPGGDFDIEVVDETITATFDSAVEALRHLQLTGVTAVRRATMGAGATRRLLASITHSDGTATLTYVVRYLCIYRSA